MRDGMKRMTHRTTFALDHDTATRIKRLAAAWDVSQAEVVRRAVARAEEAEREDADPSAALRALHASGKLLVREQAEAYLAETAAARRVWRDKA